MAVAGGRLESFAGVDQVANQQAQGEGEGGHGDEVEQGDAADLADLGGLADRSDAEHDRAKNNGPIIIFDQGDGAVPMTDRPAASLPKIRPTAAPATTATMTAMYS